MLKLKQSQRRHLRGLGHDIRPIVRTGAAGLTEAVIREVDIGLRDHELIKVKLAGENRDQRRADIERVLEATAAVLVQSIGHTVLLYRPNPEKKHRITLP